MFSSALSARLARCSVRWVDWPLAEFEAAKRQVMSREIRGVHAGGGSKEQISALNNGPFELRKGSEFEIR